MSEQWRAVPDWEGFYEVSDQGRVRSVDRIVPSRPGFTARRKGKVLRARVNTSGHLEVKLQRDGARRSVGVHRLVLTAFVGPCPEGMEACHADDDKSNNHLSNLRWDTRSANTYDKVRNGRHPMASRTHCPQGHAYTPENTYQPPGYPKRRMCRACRTKSKRRAA